MKIFCVIPAYNERNFLPNIITNLKGKVDQIIVVDDGSVDNTEEALNNLDIKVLRHPINCGQGAALKTGTLYAVDQGADIVVHFDADGQFRIEDIARLIEPIQQQQAEIVFGSRFLDKTTNLPWFKKYLIMPIARFISRWFFNIKLTDPQSGFRALSRKAAQTIDWEQDRMAHCSEILISAHNSGLTIKEVPITVLYKDFGQRFSGGVKILQDFFISKMNK